MKINYSNKESINIDETVEDINKIKGDDMNEIKAVVNANDEILSNALAEIEEIKSMDLGDTMPIGSVIEWLGDIAPTNWLILDGKAISREDYVELFEIYGTKYGAGDGSKTFNLPDLRDYVPVGKSATDSNINEIGKKYGEKNHTLSISEMPRHTHNIAGSAGAGSSSSYSRISNVKVWESNKIDSSGGSKSHNNMQPSMAVNFIVKAKMSVGLTAEVVDNFNTNSSVDAASARLTNVLDSRVSIIENKEHKTLLFDGDVNANNQENAILDISEYDFLLIAIRSDTGSRGLVNINTMVIPVDVINMTEGTFFYISYGLPNNASGSARFQIKATSITTLSGFDTWCALKRVYGIKF